LVVRALRRPEVEVAEPVEVAESGEPVEEDPAAGAPAEPTDRGADTDGTSTPR
ncbi:MAG: prolipoprotein diacylglyceryl transferase, partial [Arsenicicoccus sp.]